MFDLNLSQQIQNMHEVYLLNAYHNLRLLLNIYIFK